MKSFLLFIIFTLFGIHLLSQTEVSGILDQDTVWTKQNSPYHITGNVLVAENVLLTIEAGVVVKFDTLKGLAIKGELNAVGTAAEPIEFTSSVNNIAYGQWKSIEFRDESVDAVFDQNGFYQSGNIIKHAKISYGGQTNSFNNNVGGSIIITSSAAYIDYVDIQSSGSSGVYLTSLEWPIEGGYTRISNSIISNNSRHGVYGEQYRKQLIVYNVTFERLTNGRGVYANNVGDLIVRRSRFSNIDLDFTIVSYDTPSTIEYNNIEGNNSGGISVDGEGSIVAFNKIINSKDGIGEGIGIFAQKCSRISNNVISNCDGGIRLDEGFQEYEILNNQIINNTDIEYYYLNGTAALQVTWRGAISNINFQNNLIQGNNITDPEKGLLNFESTNNQASEILINNNNFIANNHQYYINNEMQQFDIDATNNYWGTCENDTIDTHIFDWFDNADKSIVDYLPILKEINTDAPISAPTGINKEEKDNGVLLTWNPNPEEDLKGYKVHWASGDIEIFLLEDVVTTDVGNVTSFFLEGATCEDYIQISACDLDADGKDDDVEGHESRTVEAETIGTNLTQTNKIEAETFDLYPNPTQNLLLILAQDERINSWEVFSLSGESLESGGFKNEPINVRHLSSGIYFMKIVTASGNARFQKFIKR